MQTPVPDTNGKQIDLAPWPRRFDTNGVIHFVNNGRPEFARMKNERIKPDIVILCTGYKQSFPFIDSAMSAGQSYPLPDKADVRGIWKRDDPTIGFVGFVRPSFGAIPPLAEMQAQLWIVNLLAPGKIPQALSPKDEPYYHLLCSPGARITYGVDHESYTYQLALDLGSAPGLWDIIGLTFHKHGLLTLRLPIIWAFGAHFNTKFRLKGPWRWDGALDLFISDEIWQTITRRPLLFGIFSPTRTSKTLI